jgi:hypothetical protein
MAALRLLVLSLGHAYHNSQVIGAISPKPRIELTRGLFYTCLEVEKSVNKVCSLKTERRYKQHAHTYRDIGWNYTIFYDQCEKAGALTSSVEEVA